ncbi:cytosolic iron-sulfur assembly component galla-1 [Rhodnius prolixus]
MFSPILKKIKQLVLSENNINKLCNETSQIHTPIKDDEMITKQNQEFKETVFDLVRSIRDPEKPATLEDLDVVSEDGIKICRNWDNSIFYVSLEFQPTVAHCNLATLIGLCIRVKLQKNLVHKFKLNVQVKKGTHQTEDEVNKQINDKERVSAALENPSLLEMVQNCIKEAE